MIRAGALSMLLGTMALPVPACAESVEDDSSTRQKLREYWLEKITLPPRSLDPAGAEKQIAMPNQQKQLALRQIKAWGDASKTALLASGNGQNWWGPTYAEIAPSIQYGSFQVNDIAGSGWPYLTESSSETPTFAELPVWFVDAVEQEVKKFSLAALRGQKQVVSQKVGNVSTTDQWTSQYGPGDAFVWAGPAVKDGVATYTPKDDNTTVVRISMSPGELTYIYFWAQKNGLPLQSHLLREGRPVYPHTPVIIVASTAIPVWLVNADGLIPARLTAFSLGGNSCDGSHWVEFTIKGSGTPPVWAILGFVDATRVNGVTVRRLKQEASAEERYQEAQRSEIEVHWPNERLPTLRIAARRFGWIQTEVEQGPDGSVKETGRRVLGSAWGTQVFTRRTNESGYPYQGNDLLISAAGSPLCSPP